MKMVIIEGNSALDDSMAGEANERGGVIEEDGWDPKVNFTIIVKSI